MKNIINLPTYEQVNDIKATSGAVMGDDGGKYLANFDVDYETFATKDDFIRNETFNDSLGNALKTELYGINASLMDVKFIYINEKYRLSYGTMSVNSKNTFWYAVTDIDTFKVINGGIILDSDPIGTYDNQTMKDIIITEKNLFIRVNKNQTLALAVINISTWSFVKFYRYKPSLPSGSTTLPMCIIGNTLFTVYGVAPATVYAYKMTLDINGVPTGIDPQEYSFMVAGASATGCGLATDGTFLYVSSIPSGAQIEEFKISFNPVNNSFSKIASYTLSSVPNPLPPLSYYYLATLESGKKVLVKYHLSSNDSYKSVTDLDTFTMIQSTRTNALITNPMINGKQVIYSGSVAPLLIGLANYHAAYIDDLDLKNGAITTETIYIQAYATPSSGGAPSRKGQVICSGIATDTSIYVHINIYRRFNSLERRFNLLNYSKEE